jgi:hypothetical protein
MELGNVDEWEKINETDLFQSPENSRAHAAAGEPDSEPLEFDPSDDEEYKESVDRDLDNG